MPRLVRRLIPFVLALVVTQLVAACQVGQPGVTPGAEADVTPNAVTGDAIEVTALDAPPPAAASGSDPATAPSDVAAPTAVAGTEGAAQPQGADPAAADAAAVPAAQPDLAVTEVVEEPPAPPKSEAQLACEKRDGTWSRTGKGDLRVCVFRTRDGGKRCTRESQCEGLCLARSGTCSPLKPLLGCNDILQDNGARVTQCIE
jgi:hypothetical protein